MRPSETQAFRQVIQIVLQAVLIGRGPWASRPSLDARQLISCSRGIGCGFEIMSSAVAKHRTYLSSSARNRRRIGCETVCGGLPGPTSCPRIGSASHHALPGKNLVNFSQHEKDSLAIERWIDWSGCSGGGQGCLDTFPQQRPFRNSEIGSRLKGRFWPIYIVLRHII